MANLPLRPIRTAEECKALLAASRRKLARRIREEQARKPLQVSLKAALAAALK